MNCVIRFMLCALALHLGLDCAVAQLPKGYRQVRITDDPGTFEYRPRINNRGQIVFTLRNPGDGLDREDEIFLYHDGRLIQITDDHKKDAWPDINDDGTIVWSRAIGPIGPWGPTFEIMMRTPDGRVTRLTDDDRDDYGPFINNLGHVAWYKDEGDSCSGFGWRSDVFFYDGRQTTRLTFEGNDPDGRSNQLGDINDHDEIVFTRYDFCVIGWWDSDIMLYRNGRIRQLDPDYSEGLQTPAINNDGVVV